MEILTPNEAKEVLSKHGFLFNVIDEITEWKFIAWSNEISVEMQGKKADFEALAKKMYKDIQPHEIDEISRLLMIRKALLRMNKEGLIQWQN